MSRYPHRKLPSICSYWVEGKPGKNLNQVTCPDREWNLGHLVSLLDALTVTPQVQSELAVFWFEETKSTIRVQRNFRNQFTLLRTGCLYHTYLRISLSLETESVNAIVAEVMVDMLRRVWEEIDFRTLINKYNEVRINRIATLRDIMHGVLSFNIAWMLRVVIPISVAVINLVLVNMCPVTPTIDGMSVSLFSACSRVVQQMVGVYAVFIDFFMDWRVARPFLHRPPFSECTGCASDNILINMPYLPGLSFIKTLNGHLPRKSESISSIVRCALVARCREERVALYEDSVGRKNLTNVEKLVAEVTAVSESSIIQIIRETKDTDSWASAFFSAPSKEIYRSAPKSTVETFNEAVTRRTIARVLYFTETAAHT
ncbi:hypothetical protein ANN_05061 [Periplaneta americana]|uniref:DUF4817 domain-containing protein n=1 Tax=Periplaneta americana TaxID=6978 RepID=A0ABQ8TAX9_PERAM|nr:hypothetical protein ANN_05061 [Periplaneta americana]